MPSLIPTVSLSATESPANTAPGEKKRVRLAFLDGLRGLSALYVMLYHMHIPSGVPLGLKIAWEWAHFGRSAVGVFIVLSGYSLMLPVVRSVDGQLPGGIWNYLKRRAIRILPPYYVAMAWIIALLMLAAHLGNKIGDLSHNVHAESLTAGNIAAHLLLLQNYSQQWNSGIETSMWSVSLEWQIYFLFPWLFLPLWRHFGLVAPIVAGLLIGILPLAVLPAAHNFAWASPWFAGLFAMGMAGAVISFSPDPKMQRQFQTLPWGIFAAAAFGLFLPLFAYQEYYLSEGTSRGLEVGQDTLVGLATVFLILFCCRSTHTVPIDSKTHRPLALRLLEARWAIRVGGFSYSLYLIHMPIVQKLIQWAGDHFSPLVAFGVSLAGLPVIVGLAYLFHLAFERPFMAWQRAH